MAEAGPSSASTKINSARYFCHQCNQEIVPEPEFVCPMCRLGFIEELPPNTDPHQPSGSAPFHSPAEGVNQSVEGNQLADILENIYGQFQSRTTPRDPRDEGAAPSASAIPPRTQPDLRGTTSSGVFRGPYDATQALEGIFQHIFATVQVPVPQPSRAPVGPRNRTHQMGGELNFVMPDIPMLQILHGNPGDYAWGSGGLDTVISQLLNQLDSAGTPPMSKEDINAVPFVLITAEDVANSLQCSVCMEDYKLGESVRKLTCLHCFHNDCIVPWLEMHANCPICRENMSHDGNVSRNPSVGAAASSSSSANPSSHSYYDDMADYD